MCRAARRPSSPGARAAPSAETGRYSELHRRVMTGLSEMMRWSQRSQKLGDLLPRRDDVRILKCREPLHLATKLLEPSGHSLLPGWEGSFSFPVPPPTTHRLFVIATTCTATPSDWWPTMRHVLRSVGTGVPPPSVARNGPRDISSSADVWGGGSPGLSHARLMRRTLLGAYEKREEPRQKSNKRQTSKALGH